jgi:hypothetical protein
MRIATWNVQRPTGSDKRARLVEYIERINADVWVLIETAPGLRPSAMHACAHTAESAGQPGVLGAAIWSRHAIRGLSATTDPTRVVAAAITLADGGELIVYGAAIVTDTQRDEWVALRRQHPAAEFCVAGHVNGRMASLEPAFVDAQLACVTQGEDDPVFAQSGGERAATEHIALSADLAERVSGRGSWPAGIEPVRELSEFFGIYIDLD